jgi:acyl-CoA synthetase (AMP-forming)/AMP-acid ligase II
VNVVEFLDRGALIAPDAVAFVRPDGTGAMTFREVESFTHRVAAALRRDGAEPGTPVAVLSHNSPMVLPCVLGVLRAGCAWVAANARSTATDLAALTELVGTRWLLTTSELAAMASQLSATVPTLDHVISVDGEFAGASPLEDWLPAEATVEIPDLGPDAVAGFFGTGGTTGAPKAVVVPHRAIATMVHGFHAHMPEDAPVNLVAAPLTHAAGAATFPVLALGGRTVVHDGVVPADLLESIERHHVTRLFLPPTAIYALLAHPDVRSYDLSSLRYFLYGAAPMSTDKLIQAMDVFGPVMAQCYGQTEAAMICAFLSPAEHREALADPALRQRLASCGRPSLVASVSIRDEQGRPVARGERGEITVRTPLQMSGYHDDPAATDEVRLPGGWQATGDVGYMDDDGYLYIVDRVRDLIISGGFNVFPSEVERVILAHPGVRDCAVIGVPDEKWGERVTAIVEVADADADRDALAVELIAACRGRLGSVKAPKEVVFGELPRSPVGKVLKRALRDEAWSGRSRQV